MGCVADCWYFYPGETLKIQMRLREFDRESDCKEPFQISTDANRIIKVTLPGDPDDIVLDLLTSPAVVVVNETLGQIEIELTPTQTALMRSGSIIVEHDALGDGTDVRKGVGANVVCKQKVPSC